MVFATTWKMVLQLMQWHYMGELQLAVAVAVAVVVVAAAAVVVVVVAAAAVGLLSGAPAGIG